MALEIYKPGQGYWTRVLSAIGYAVVILSAVAFIWQQLELLGSQDTRSAPTSALVSGLAKLGADGKQPIASISALSEIKLDAAAGQVKIKDNTLKQEYALPMSQFATVFDASITQTSQTSKLPPVPAANAVNIALNARDGSVSVSYQSFAARNRLYIQSAVAVILLLVSGIGGFYVMNRADIVEFFIATEGEMRKVNWPSRRELIGATWLVICGTIILSLGIMVVDASFIWFFRKIDVIQTVTSAAH